MKVVRTTNDNVASMFYEAMSGDLPPGEVSVSSLVMYQWIGFAVCIFSLASSFLLSSIHESVIDNDQHSEVKEKSKELKRSGDHQSEDEDDEETLKNEGKNAPIMQLLSRQVLIIMVINAMGYASVHAFYPNMSKFFQNRFGFSNVEAGHISSLPYLIASFAVPIFGSVSSVIGDAYFELMLFAAIGMVFAVHVMYLSISDFDASESDSWLLTVMPLVLLGVGHALFTTIQSPIVPKVVKNELHLSRVFTYIKITESIAITFFIYLAGFIR